MVAHTSKKWSINTGTHAQAGLTVPQLMTIMDSADLSALFPPSLVLMSVDSQPDGWMDINGPSRSNNQLGGWMDINKGLSRLQGSQVESGHLSQKRLYGESNSPCLVTIFYHHCRCVTGGEFFHISASKCFVILKAFISLKNHTKMTKVFQSCCRYSKGRFKHLRYDF